MGISVWQLLIILAIVLVIFGAKRLKSLGSDIGGAIKNFKQSMKDEESGKPQSDKDQPQQRISDGPGRVIDGEVVEKKKHSA